MQTHDSVCIYIYIAQRVMHFSAFIIRVVTKFNTTSSTASMHPRWGMIDFEGPFSFRVGAFNTFTSDLELLVVLDKVLSL